MQPSNKLIDFVANIEGFRPNSYKPLPTDRWTVGYGFTLIKGIPVKEGDSITQSEAKIELQRLLVQVAKVISLIKLPTTVTQQQFDAVCSLCYNIGTGAFMKSDTGKLFYAGKNISDKFALYDRSGGIVIGGLYKRRIAEKKIYDSGEYK